MARCHNIVYVMVMAPMTRNDWFEVASRQLVAHGEAGLTLASLTAAAGVTQGSYYHHFGGRQGFLDAFLTYLEARAFLDVAAMLEEDALAADPATPVGARLALRRLVAVIASEDLAFEAAVRRWAHGNPRVAAVIARIDARRAELLERLFLAATGDPARAAYLTRLNGAFYLGAVHAQPPIQGEEYLRMAGDLERLAEGPAPVTGSPPH